MRRKLKATNELFYLFGMILCALGVTLSANSGFGVSMVVAPAYVLHRYFVQFFPWFSFGVAEYLWQGILIFVTAAACRTVKWKYLFGALGVLFYGTAVDLWRLILGTEVWPTLPLRILSAVAGAVVVAFSIALLLRTYLPQQSYELCVQEITARYRLPMPRVKWAFDIASLVFSVVLMLVFFGRFDTTMIGVSTLVLTVVNAPMITFFGRMMEKVSDFSTAFPRFHEAYLEKLD